MRRIGFLCLLAFGLASVLPVQAQSTPDGPSGSMLSFARAIAVDGETVYVGEPQTAHHPGRVFVYNPSESGWTSSSTVQAEDGEVGDGFGTSIAANESTLVVGAPSTGAAYVFTKQNGSWQQANKLTPTDSTAGFGRSLAMTEGRLAVGAYARGSKGAVFVYEQQGDGTWAQTARIESDQPNSGSGFGRSLTMHEGQLLIGTPVRKGGSVFAYAQDASGSWSRTQTLSGPSGGASEFGSVMQTAGDQVLIGAPELMEGTGAVFAYRYDAESESWTSAGQLLPFDGTTQHGFGAAVAFDGQNAWVGAPGAADDTGALYRFAWDAESGSWSGTQRYMHDGAGEGDELGAPIAAVDGLVAVGLSGADFGAGRMAIYTEEGGSWTATETMAPDASSSGLAAMTGERRDCSDGQIGEFPCKNVDMFSFLPISEIGGQRGVALNDVWGWTDPETGKEYALVGRIDGTSFVDVTDPTNPVYIGELPLTDGARPNSWRDIKVYQNHAYVVADNAGEHGMQVFDLTKLRDVAASEMPVTFEETSHYNEIHSAHNVVINEDTGFAYVVGSSGGGKTCGGGLHMVNIQNPAEPQFAGCFADKGTGRTGSGYTHDAQCVVYQGPDEEYQGDEICLGANETAISIANVSDKENPVSIATASYPDHAYVHQGWLTEDHRYFYVNDELDEINNLTKGTRTLIWDVSDLDNPQLVGTHRSTEPSTDHNLYVKGETMYQSNYVSGLRVLDVSNPTEPQEVGYLDTVPYGDNGPGFGGTWSNYPFFESGKVVVSSMQEGLFILRKSKQEL